MRPALMDAHTTPWHIRPWGGALAYQRYQREAQHRPPNHLLYKGPVMLSRIGVLTNVDVVATVNPFTRGVLDY